MGSSAPRATAGWYPTSHQPLAWYRLPTQGTHRNVAPTPPTQLDSPPIQLMGVSEDGEALRVLTTTEPRGVDRGLRRRDQRLRCTPNGSPSYTNHPDAIKDQVAITPRVIKVREMAMAAQASTPRTHGRTARRRRSHTRWLMIEPARARHTQSRCHPKGRPRQRIERQGSREAAAPQRMWR